MRFPKLKLILRDQEFWLALVGATSLAADAVSEGSVSIFRGVSVAAMVGLLISRAVKLLRMYARKHVPLVAVIGKADAQYRDTLSQVELALQAHRIPIADLERTFGLYHEDWVFHRESLLPTDSDSWKQDLAKVQRKFWRLAERVPGRKVYHFFVNGPAAFALGMGAMLGSRTEYVFYQYVAGGEGTVYQPQIDFRPTEYPQGPHILKTRVDTFEHIRVEGKDSIPAEYEGEILAAIHLAGHNPRGEVERFNKDRKWPLVFIDSEYGGTIPLDGDWVRIAREISNVLLELAADRRVDRLHLFLSMPLPLAFAVGSALGPFVRASVYNYFPSEGTYNEVFQLEGVW